MVVYVLYVVKRFPKMKGKTYCSEECRWKSKGYPSIEEVNEQYELLGNLGESSTTFWINS